MTAARKGRWGMRHKYDAAAEMAIIFIKDVPLAMFWITVVFGLLLGTDELQRNWSICLKSFFIMAVAAVAGTTFFHRLGIRIQARKARTCAQGGDVSG